MDKEKLIEKFLKADKEIIKNSVKDIEEIIKELPTGYKIVDSNETAIEMIIATSIHPHTKNFPAKLIIMNVISKIMMYKGIDPNPTYIKKAYDILSRGHPENTIATLIYAFVNLLVNLQRELKENPKKMDNILKQFKDLL